MSRPAPRRPSYQHYYAKRLNTESFTAPALKDELEGLADRFDHQIEGAKRNMRVKHLKMFRAKEKLKTIQNEEQHMRETLRSSIEQKLKQSQSNLEKMVLTKNSQSKSKEKFRETTLSRIESMKKTSKEEAFKRAEQYSKETETFLIDKRRHDLSRNSSYSQASTKTRYQSNITNYNDLSEQYLEQSRKQCENLVLIESRKRVLPNILRVSEADIKRRQLRKIRLEKGKQIKNLHDYVQKLNNIDAKRQTRSLKLTETAKLLEKNSILSRKKYENRRQSRNVGQDASTNCIPRHTTKAIINNRQSFSELYTKKLEQKQNKKAYFAEMVRYEGDRIMMKDQETRLHHRENRLLRQTLKEVQLRANFKYLEFLRK